MSDPARRPKLAVRDPRVVERADCIDCVWTTRGKGARHRAGGHALRSNHRVNWTRTSAAELRPVRWPAEPAKT